MLPPKCPAMLLMLAAALTCQSLASASQKILSNPLQLQVRTEPRRAAVLVSRTVKSAAAGGGGSTPTDAADNGTTAMTPQDRTTPQTSKATGVVEVVFAGVRELDDQSNEVGGQAHSFYRFDDEKIGFLTTLSGQNSPSGGFQGVCQDSRAALSMASEAESPNATLVAKMCAVQSNAAVQEIPLVTGQFLLSVDVDGWEWYQQEGQFLEFNLSVVVPEGRKVSMDENTGSSDGAVKISLGTNDSFIMISTEYGVTPGGSSMTTWKPLPAGYPKLTMREENTGNLTVRVPRQTATNDRLTVMTLAVEPGYLSAEHFGPISSAPRYLGTSALVVATGVFLATAALFSRR